MTTIGEAAEAIGLEPQNGFQPLIAVLDRSGRYKHFPLSKVADRVIKGELFAAGALFAPTDLTEYTGRTRENVKQVLWLAFDFDLTDYTGLPAERIHEWPEQYLRDAVHALIEEARAIFAQINLPVHRWDYTGHGCCAYVYLPHHDLDALEAIVVAYKGIVERINLIAGTTLADVQVSDAGTRITRLPPSPNRKGSVEKISETLDFIPFDQDPVTLEQVYAAAGPHRPPTRRIVPTTGEMLPDKTVQDFVNLIEPHWVEGNRHLLALALAGMLAKAGVPEEQAARIIAALSVHDPEADDRMTAVKTSYDRVRSGRDLRGFTGLTAALPEDAVLFIDHELETIRRATSPRIVIGSGKQPGRTSFEDESAEIEQRIGSYGVVPELAYFGWFGRYRDLMAPTSEAPDQFHLGAALVLAGALTGRRVAIRYNSEPLYTSLYAVLAGRTGTSRKDTAIKRAIALPDFMPPQKNAIWHTPYLLMRDVSSSEGLIKRLKDYPNGLIYLSELSAMMKNAKRKGTSTILDVLIQAWDSPARLQNLSKFEPSEAIEPFVSIISATQPGRLARAMQDEEIESGFANRWLYIFGIGKVPIARTPDIDEAVAQALITDLWRAISVYDENTTLHMAPDAFDRWDEWYYRSVAEMSEDEDQADIRTRHSTMIQKIALIYAICEEASAVHDRHFAAAIALVDWTWDVLKKVMRAWGARDEVQLEEKIVQVLQAFGAMRKRELQQRCSNRKWSARDFGTALEWMRKNGQIDVDGFGTVALAEGE